MDIWSSLGFFSMNAAFLWKTKKSKYFLMDTEVKVRIRFRCSIALFSYNTICINGINPLLFVWTRVRGRPSIFGNTQCTNPQWAQANLPQCIFSSDIFKGFLFFHSCFRKNRLTFCRVMDKLLIVCTDLLTYTHAYPIKREQWKEMYMFLYFISWPWRLIRARMYPCSPSMESGRD